MPYRLRRTVFGTFVLEVQETRHHITDLNGSGYYDEYSSKHWRKATLQEAIDSGLKVEE